jgi:hypothetical protein
MPLTVAKGFRLSTRRGLPLSGGVSLGVLFCLACPADQVVPICIGHAIGFYTARPTLPRKVANDFASPNGGAHRAYLRRRAASTPGRCIERLLVERSRRRSRMLPRSRWRAPLRAKRRSSTLRLLRPRRKMGRSIRTSGRCRRQRPSGRDRSPLVRPAPEFRGRHHSQRHRCDRWN